MHEHRNPRQRLSKQPTTGNPPTLTPDAERITVDARILDALLISIASAARFIERHDSLTLGPLASDIDEIGRAVREIRNGRAEPDASEPFEITSATNRLHQLIARADALTHAARSLSEDVAPDDADELRQRRERIAHLVGDAAEATEDAAEASRRLLLQLGTQQGEA